jgi:glycosyltransferase involved in cell wall biosynthesis
MRLGIDASNLRSGGATRHLIELLRVADPTVDGFREVHVWGGRSTLDGLEERPWLIKSHQRELDGGLFSRTWWQRFRLSRVARQAGCHVILVPGGSYSGTFHPVATMSRNMLPFEWRELRRYAWSFIGLRLLMLRWIHSRTYRRADGVIFLTRYARDAIIKVIGSTSGPVAIVPHGVDGELTRHPRAQEKIERYSSDRPFKIIYVSIIDRYKHQWEVAEAIGTLRSRGIPVALELVGPAYRPSLDRLRKVIKRVDPGGKFIFYRGSVPYRDLTSKYAEADLCVFASSCENMPNILLEGMASGLPIACSNRGPMPEVLGDGGVYFDPESEEDIGRAIAQMIDSPELRTRLAAASASRVREFSWERCARETFKFLARVASKGRDTAAMGAS